MLKASGFVFSAGLILGGGARAYGQADSPSGPSRQMPQEMAERQTAQDRQLEEEAPEFYAFQAKLRGIETEIEKIIESFAKKEIDKDTAKQELLPLVKEAQEIQKDPGFLVEQRLAQVCLSSPEYREKVEKDMRALAEKKKRKPKKSDAEGERRQSAR